GLRGGGGVRCGGGGGGRPLGRGGGGGAGGAGRLFFLGGVLRRGHGVLKILGRPAVARGMCRPQHRWCPQEHRLRWPVRAASMRRREPNLPATFPPVACRGAVLRRACRMSERGTTGTANRQHPFIRAGGGRWQGSR